MLEAERKKQEWIKFVVTRLLVYGVGMTGGLFLGGSELDPLSVCVGAVYFTFKEIIEKTAPTPLM